MASNLINTLIFAIRHWQATGATYLYPDLEAGNHNVLEDCELDEVCEALNLGELFILDIDAGDILKQCLPLVQGIVESQPEDREDNRLLALRQRIETLFLRAGWTIEPAPMEEVTRHWIVTGRRHGDDEATTSYVTTSGQDCPVAEFVRNVLFSDVKDDEDLPDKIWDENADGDEKGWYHDATFEIAGPPLSQST